MKHSEACEMACGLHVGILSALDSRWTEVLFFGGITGLLLCVHPHSPQQLPLKLFSLKNGGRPQSKHTVCERGVRGARAEKELR